MKNGRAGRGGRLIKQSAVVKSISYTAGMSKKNCTSLEVKGLSFRRISYKHRNSTGTEMKNSIVMSRGIKRVED